MKLTFVLKGGSGSGNFGHAGRPGEVGGSQEGSGPGTSATPAAAPEHISGGKAPSSVLNENSPYRSSAGQRSQYGVHSDFAKFTSSAQKLADYLRPNLDKLSFDDKSTARIFLEEFDKQGVGNEFEIESHTLSRYSEAAEIAAAIAHGKYVATKGYDAYNFNRFQENRRDVAARKRFGF